MHALPKPKSRSILSMMRLSLPLLLSSPLLAHGGGWSGPQDLVPIGRPNKGGVPIPTCGTCQPGDAPAPTNAGRRASSTPTSPNSPGTVATGRGAPKGFATPGLDLSTPLTSWTVWWEFNKHRHLDLAASRDGVPATTGGDEFNVGLRPQAIDRVRTSRTARAERIRPLLVEVLNGFEERTRDEVTAALIALAKLGIHTGGSSDLITRFLGSNDQEIQESAALALGILGSPQSVPTLLALAMNTGQGKRLVQEREVSLRTRCFAIHGLGILTRRVDDVAEPLRRTVAHAVLETLARDASPQPDVRIACVQTLASIHLQDTDLETFVLPPLVNILSDRSTPNLTFVRAHVPRTLARLGRAEFLETFLTMSTDDREGLDVKRSVVQAIGTLAPHLDRRDRKRATHELVAFQRGASDLQARGFACIALGQLGTDQAIEHLVSLLGAGPSIHHPWACLALGLHERSHEGDRQPDPAIVARIEHVLETTGDGARKGAMAIALGLMNSRRSQTLLQRELDQTRIGEYRGYLAIALGMLREPSTQARLLKELDASSGREDELRQVAIALGLLGDRAGVERLLQQAHAAKTALAQAAIARALGFIGDARAITPLGERIRDANQPAMARAYAIVALGILGDHDDLPFSADLQADFNYRAAVPTLLGGGIGLLEIL